MADSINGFINMLKLSYSRYTAALFLNAPSEKEINTKIDKVIDCKMEDKINGDGDLKQVVLYAINWRKVERRMIFTIPILDSEVFIRAIIKSLFTSN